MNLQSTSSTTDGSSSASARLNVLLVRNPLQFFGLLRSAPEEFHWTRGESAGVQSMAMLTYTFIAPVVGASSTALARAGSLFRGHPSRYRTGSLLYNENLFQFYLFYGVLMAAGSTCIAIVAYSAILAHWFERKEASPAESLFPAWTWHLPFGPLSKTSSLPTDGDHLCHSGRLVMLIALP